MRKTKFSHKVLSLFLTCTFLPSILPINYLYASNNGPTAPEAASFEPVDAIDMVNLSSGDLSYVLPLLEVPSPEGGYPLALSYHAGVALDQEASWVGLGWNLNPGALNRNVVGVPDDWKNGLKSKISYDEGGTITVDNLSSGIGITDEISVGLNASWITNKTSGGERSINFGTNLYASGEASFGNGVTGRSNVAASINSNGSFSAQATFTKRVQSKRQSSSVGVGFESIVGAAYARSNSSNSDQTRTSGSFSSLPVGINLSIGFDLGLFNVQYNRNRFKYWQFDEKDYYATGSLYAGNFDSNTSTDPLYFFNEFDGSESLSSTVDYSATFSENNPAYVTYDNYNVNAQGLNANISPKLLEMGRIHTSEYQVADKSLYKIVDGNERKVDYVEGYSYVFEGGSDFRPTLFSKSMENDTNKPHFYVENEFSSYHKTFDATRSNFLNGQNEVNFSQLLRGIQYFPEITSEGYSNMSSRLKKGNYIEAYTNKELLNKPYLVYEVSDLQRESMPEDGIGAFKVTVMDGKTYHYSLPVYQKESSQQVARSDADITLEHMETQSLYPYATHWLLTAITGPDFVDNGDGRLNEGDFGYWVRFDYGKWSDGYAWRMPKTGFNYTDNAKTYSWGVKDIYYLNSITTRTHTALFVKKERMDNLSSEIGVHDTNNNPIFRNALYRAGSNPNLLHRGLDGNWYFAGVYRRLNLGSDPGLLLYNNPTIENENWFYAKSKQIKSYALNEIILLKNGDVPDELKSLSLSSGNSDQDQQTNSEIKFEEQTFYAIGNNTYNTEKEAYVDNVYRGEYYNNILDSEDFDFGSLRSKALKTIDFGYSYSLGKENNTGGKLSLKSVNFKSKKGIAVMPSYKFDYYGENEIGDRNNYDSWGHHKSTPWIWSLRTITNPLGGKISIQYESDTFFEKAVATSYLDNNLQVKFEGTNGGAKYISVRQDPDIKPQQKLDFLNYFKVDDFYNLDVQFFQDPNNNGDNWIADVAASSRAVSVSEDVVKFQLPTNSNKTWVRLKTNCEKQNWVYYQSGEYNHVVDVTENWKGEEREGSCDIPGDGNRKIRIKVFFDVNDKEQRGGGLRTHKVTLEDGQGRSFDTTYDYSMLNGSTGISSGTTSYAPERLYQKDIPYLDLLPSPGVVYKNVRVKHFDNTYVDYEFETLGDYIIDASGYENNLLKINKVQGESLISKQAGQPRYFQIDEKFFNVESKLNFLGSLLSVKQYNSENQLMGSTINSYLQTGELENKFITESFAKEEKLNIDDTFDIPVNLSTTTVSYIPLVLKQVKTIRDNYTRIINNNLFDPITGQVLESITTNAAGDSLRNKLVPAYTQYPFMGSKVDNPDYKHMLTQKAMTISDIFIGNAWQTTAVSVNTWRSEHVYGNANTTVSDGIWRKHQNFVWKDDVAANGTLGTRITSADFNWGTGAVQSDPQWQKISETTRYDHWSSPLEIKDINGNFAATKMGDDDKKIFATGNAAYTELFFSGAEDLNGNVFGGQVAKGTAARISSEAHTGSYAMQVAAGQTAFVVSAQEGKRDAYKVSLWAKQDLYQNVRLQVGGAVMAYNEDEIVRAGSWVQLNFYFKINGTQSIHVTAAGGSAIVDDFRLHPVASTMTSYVYNEWDELTHILGANNLGTRFEYDEAGRLSQTFTEVADFDGNGSGGFKRTRRHAYTYKTNINQ